MVSTGRLHPQGAPVILVQRHHGQQQHMDQGDQPQEISRRINWRRSSSFGSAMGPVPVKSQGVIGQENL